MWLHDYFYSWQNLRYDYFAMEKIKLGSNLIWISPFKNDSVATAKLTRGVTFKNRS